MMEELRIIWLLAIGLGLACILGYGAQAARIPPIVGYLLAGYLIGPNSPGFVADISMAEQLANLGVTLLMFAVGLNFNWKDLIAVKSIVLPGALTISGFSIILTALYSFYTGETLISGLVIGLAICVSSTVVIVRVLSDQGLLNTLQGHVVLGWTIVEDLISVFGLILLPALVPKFTQTDNQFVLGIVYSIFWTLIKIGALAVFIHFIGEKLIDRILKIIARTRSHELFTLAILTCVFIIAIFSSYLFGVSLALGAFIAGTIIGKTEVSHQAAANALPMRDAFAVIFFISVGMLFNPIALTNNLKLFFGALFVLIIVRPLLAFLFISLSKYPMPVAFTVALAQAQIGEYSFILAEEGSQLNILPDIAFDVIVACSFITIGLNTLLFQLFQSICKKHVKPVSTLPLKELSFDFLNESKSKPDAFLPRAIIIGFGPIGQDSAKYLIKKGFRVLIIDQNIDTVTALKRQNVETIFGDATQFHILEKAEIENARLLIITTPDFLTTKSIIQTAKNINSYIQIIARIRFKGDSKNDVFEGIPIVCDEESSSEKFISVIAHTLF